MHSMEKNISVAFRSKLKYAEMAIMVLNHLKSIANMDDDDFFKIEISVREAINNAIVHGNRSDADKSVKVKFAWTEKRLQIEVWDESGESTDLSQIENKIKSCDLLSYNGRGINIMRSYMDTFDFQCLETGNCVTMEKKLK